MSGCCIEDILKNLAHILVIGETQSGKTLLVKYIITKLSPSNLYVFTTNTDEYKNYTKNIYSNFNVIKQIKEDIQRSSSPSMKLIVFDDFNNEINTKVDKEYTELFTRFRHFNTYIINISHSVKSVGNIVRNNCRYIFIMSSFNNNESIKELAVQYFNSENYKLKKLLNDAFADNPYNTIFIDRFARKANIFRAPQRVDNIITPPEGSNLLNSPEDTNYISPVLSGSSVNLNLSKQMNAGRDVTDYSRNQYHIDNRLSSNQLFQQKLEQHKIKMEMLYQDSEYQREKNKILLKDMLLNSNRTIYDKYQIIKLLKQFATKPLPIDLKNYLEFGQAFLEVHFNMTCQLYENAENNYIEKGINMACSFNQNPLLTITDTLWNNLNKKSN